jgi:hypothetical protein
LFYFPKVELSRAGFLPAQEAVNKTALLAPHLARNTEHLTPNGDHAYFTKTQPAGENHRPHHARHGGGVTGIADEPQRIVIVNGGFEEVKFHDRSAEGMFSM